MLVELNACPFIVTVLRDELNTHDVDVITEWLQNNLTGKLNVINIIGSSAKLSFGGNGKHDEALADALFMFSVYQDALHFQMRFIG